jgi:colanic acid/amylovoran biosynthesis glycosyltransferase
MMARQPSFDIVHCQFGYEGLVAHRHRRLGTLRTRALICHFRGSDLTRYVRENGRGVYRWLFGDAELLIANCDYFRRRLLDLGAPADRTIIIGSPIDTGFFAPPKKPRETYDGRRALRLVAVGRLAEKKGFADAIDAVAKLEDRDATLEIYGDGPLRAQLEARAQDHGLANRVTFHGPAVAREILAGLHRADIALAPSVTAQDGDADAPVNTLKEAMATGLPVIATRHGGIPELVEHGVNGLLVPERDPAAIAAALRELAAAPERWHTMGQCGREAVVERYGLEEVASMTLAAYRRALGYREAG